MAGQKPAAPTVVVGPGGQGDQGKPDSNSKTGNAGGFPLETWQISLLVVLALFFPGAKLYTDLAHFSGLRRALLHKTDAWLSVVYGGGYALAIDALVYLLLLARWGQPEWFNSSVLFAGHAAFTSVNAYASPFVIYKAQSLLHVVPGPSQMSTFDRGCHDALDYLQSKEKKKWCDKYSWDIVKSTQHKLWCDLKEKMSAEEQAKLRAEWDAYIESGDMYQLLTSMIHRTSYKVIRDRLEVG
ncbi:MAG TPA: hypothetical protein VGS20_00900 [Candidatus Acidoferrales bacterium]|nr:hypothetical protein [Candidatus Acidoferrales bacterium]